MRILLSQCLLGDTFEPEDGKFFRLSGFDAPELNEAIAYTACVRTALLMPWRNSTKVVTVFLRFATSSHFIA